MLVRSIAIAAFVLAAGCGSASRPADAPTTVRPTCPPGQTLITVPGGRPADDPLLHGPGCERTTFDTTRGDGTGP